MCGSFKEGAYRDKYSFERRRRHLEAECLKIVLQSACKNQALGFQLRGGDGVTRHWVPYVFNFVTDHQEQASMMKLHGYNCPRCDGQLADDNDAGEIGVGVRCRTSASVQKAVEEAQDKGLYGGDAWKQKYQAAEPTARALVKSDGGNAAAGSYGACCRELVSAERFRHCSSVLGVQPDTNPLWSVGGTFDIYTLSPPDPMHMAELGLKVKTLTGVVLLFRLHMGVHDDKVYCDDDVEDSDADGESEMGDPRGGLDGGQGGGPAVRKETKDRAMRVWEEIRQRLKRAGMKKFVCDKVYHAFCNGKNDRGKVDFGLTADETSILFRRMVGVIQNLLPDVEGREGAPVGAAVTRCMVAVLRWYGAAGAPCTREDEMPKLQQRAVDLLKLLKETFAAVMEWKNPKAHMLLHVVGSCLVMFGCLANCSAEVLELHHTVLKAACVRTNRREGWQKQVMQGMMDKDMHGALVAEMDRAEDVRKRGREEELSEDDQELGPGEELEEEEEWVDSRGVELQYGHGGEQNLGKRIRRRRNFPLWEAALDRENTKVQLSVRMKRGKGEGAGKGSRHVNMLLMDVRQLKCDWTLEHLKPDKIRQLPFAMARYFVAQVPGKMGVTADVKGRPYSQMHESTADNILKANMADYNQPDPNQVGRCPIRVMTRLTFENTRLTGGAHAWGKFAHAKHHIMRCFPFKKRLFHGSNLMPVVAFVPYAPLGPEGETDGNRSRPTILQAQVEKMGEAGDGGGVCFGRVMLMFQASEKSNGKQDSTKDYAYIQPLLRYKPASELDLTKAEKDWVCLYEPSENGVGDTHKHEVVPVVVSPLRILCEVPTLPSFGMDCIPQGVDVSRMPGAKASGRDSDQVGSPLLWADLVELKWYRTAVVVPGV